MPFIQSGNDVLNLSKFFGWTWTCNENEDLASLRVIDLDREMPNLGLNASFVIDQGAVNHVNRKLMSGESVKCENFCTLK